MDQPPQDPSQPAQPAPPPPGPAWGQPAAPPPPQYAPPPPPQYAPPPQQAPAGWAQPAPAGNQWVQPAAVKGPVTSLARLAGIVIALIGALWTFVGVLFIIGGAASKTFLDNLKTGTDVGNAIGGALAVVGIVIVVFGLIELLGGLAAALGKDWGRVVSIIFSFLFGVPLLLITISAATAARNERVGNDATVALLILVVHVVAYVFAAIILMAKWRGRARA